MWLKPNCQRLHTDSGGGKDEYLRFTTHSFRIGFINRMLRVLSLPEVSNVIGYSSVQTTLIYSRSNDDMSYCADKLEAFGDKLT